MALILLSSIKKIKTDKNAIAEGFNHFVISIVKTISEKLSQRSSKIACQRQQSPLQNTEATFTNESFELSLVRSNGVYNLLRKLNVNKATGLDNIPARLLKDGGPVISECLTHIINLSFSLEWCQTTGRLQELFLYSNSITEKKWITIVPFLFLQ